jgi:hypothetical protein
MAKLSIPLWAREKKDGAKFLSGTLFGQNVTVWLDADAAKLVTNSERANPKAPVASIEVSDYRKKSDGGGDVPF